jgi:PST family polysaccharide transporter
MWNFIPALLLASIYPILVEERQLDAKNYRARLQIVFDGLTGLGYLVAVVGMLLAPLLIRAIYGAKFAGAAEILMIQAWTAPVVFSGSVRAQYFLLENLTLYHTISALLGIVVNVALSLWLMSRIGVAGAAVAALVGYVVAGYLTSLLFPPLRECGRLQTRAFLLPFRIPSLVRVRLAR